MRRLVGPGAAAACLLLGGCLSPKPSSPTAADLAKIDLTPDHTITVDDDGFDPAALEVRAGDVVRLVNQGPGPHSFSADTRFDTGRLQPGDETILVLTEPGKISYRDLEAPDHRASITVARSARPARPARLGRRGSG